jgi:FeS assembly SUF system protein
MADERTQEEDANDPKSEAGRLSGIEQKLMENSVINVLHSCYDPEIPVNIYDLGLIYDVAVNDVGEVEITMTLTSPHCPAAQSLPGEVQQRAGGVPGVTAVKVNVTWTPPWNMSMMSDVAKLELGYM